MARIRTIKPEFCTSEQIGECSTTARLLFVELWCFCDDAGRHPASPLRLKAECFPFDSFTREQMEGFIDELVDRGLLVEYRFEGQKFWQVTGWHHQKIDKPSIKYGPKETVKVSNGASICKPLPIDSLITRGRLTSGDNSESVEEDSTSVRLGFDEDSTNTSRGLDDSPPPDRKGMERKGKEGKGEDRSHPHSLVEKMGEPFRAVWKRWRAHQRENFTPLTPTAEEAALMELARCYPGQEGDQIQVVEFSILRRAKNLITNGDHRKQQALTAGVASGGQKTKGEQDWERILST